MRFSCFAFAAPAGRRGLAAAAGGGAGWVSAWVSAWVTSWVASLVVGLVAGAAGPASAQEPYPTKPVRLIVPFPPGGGADTLARLVMNAAAKDLGQPLVVENLAGAGGNLGSQTAARAAPDGHTLLYATNGTLAINQTLFRAPGFDAQRDFEPVSRLTRIAAVLVVRPDFPAQTLPELLKLLRARPGKYTFGSAGNGTTSHLAGELLKLGGGFSMVHIPYRGGAPALTDLIGGQIDLMVEVMPNAAPQVRGGRLKALAVSTAQRVGSMPEVPTIAESGVPGFDVSAWDAIVLPKGTPAPIVARWSQAIQAALASPELRRQLQERGAEAAPLSGPAFSSFLKSEATRWGDAVRRSGAVVD